MMQSGSLREVALDDTFDLDRGRVLIDSVQALVRLPLLQRRMDEAAGLSTSGFISGYRGSPLGRLDDALFRQRRRLYAAGVVFQPGVNEDLAATAIWGTQQLDAVPGATVDGVFGLWYGKGPGVDRSLDVLKHANFAGTHRHGGVLVVFGDDHPGKSSTIAHQSEQALSACLIPVLYPSSVQEFIGYGLLGWALSRYCGLWVGFKTVNETVEQTATVDVDAGAWSALRPPRPPGTPALHYAPGFRPPQETEILVRRHRLPAALDFIRANRIDRQVLGGGGGLGIVTAGKSHTDVLQALRLLDIDDARAASLGIGLYKVGCIWPLEPDGIAAFAAGRPELLCVEEKAAFLEPQVARILFNGPERPRLLGKRDERGDPLLPSDVQLDARLVATVIGGRLEALGRVDERLRARLDDLKRDRERPVPAGPGKPRTPYFCSGCPHNSSTRVPDGSLAMAGIGCHTMAILNRADTLPPTHMGGEGINWTGLSRFTSTRHIFQNLGDGTYYHSGLLAIRAAVASGANITYKILYNDAVAMTGGQPIDGPLSVGMITRQVLAEGVKACIVVTDNPDAYAGAADLAPGVTVRHRDDLDRVQRELRGIEGTTVLVYEQTCAAEKRRRRKRGEAPDPAMRLFINAAVCEGCGDCSAQSTCVSLVPKETAFGTKRAIDQSTCNKDFSCLKGFCPSFVTVRGGGLRKRTGAAVDRAAFGDMPDPAVMPLDGRGYNIMIAGIGGTGVITVGAILGMAAHLEGKAASIFDMTGLSQKNGAVYSHLRIARAPADIAAARIGAGEADLVLGFDLVAALSGDAAAVCHPGSTRVVGNSAVAPTSAFQFDGEARPDAAALQALLRERAGAAQVTFVDAARLALELCGDTVMANLFMVGVASQGGLLPVGPPAILRAIELNGVSVEANRQAFELGRLWSHAPRRLQAMAGRQPEERPWSEKSVDEIVGERAAHLAAYQDQRLAQRYLGLVDRVRAAEGRVAAGDRLSRAVANGYAKLLAYKDEYEVARLYADPAFMAALDAQFEGKVRLGFNLAPPLLSRRDPVTGHPRKREFGPWVLHAFRLLARMKGLRGTPLDIFGHTAERRRERRLIVEYEQSIERIIGSLTPANHGTAVELAMLPDRIRGFGHVKEKSIAAAQEQRAALLARLLDGTAGSGA